MDNITHSLAGVLLHGVASRRRQPALDKAVRSRLSRALFWSVLIASNFPDLDSLYAGISGHAKLGYLLHHRGHTHTLAFTLPVGLLSAALGLAIARLRPSRLPRGELLVLGALSWLAAVLHVSMDAWNTYGVHPFWPLDSRWYYGDVIFIVEPWIWFAWLPYAWVGAGRVGRWIWGVLGAGMVALSWGVGYLPWAFALGTTLWLALQAFAQLRLRHRPELRLGLALGSWALVFSMFFVGSRTAASRVEQAHSELFPRERLVELTVSPGPANPSCLFVLALSAAGEGPGAEIHIRKGTYAYHPSSETASFCRTRFEMGPGMPAVSEPVSAEGGRLRFDAVWSAPLAEFRRLASDNCRFSAFLRFARFPFWKDGHAADARFDRAGRGGDFTGIELDEGECPVAIPPWVPPLEELLE